MGFEKTPVLKKGFHLGGILNRTLPDPAPAESLIPSNLNREERWMALALLEAMNGIGWSSPNPSVGCILVQDDQCVARGFTQFYGGKHAERMAFESLGKNLDSMTNLEAYVTLEPCSHFGKQPPCADLFLHPAIRRVILACEDPNPLVAGEGIRRLRENGKKVEIGILKEEIQAWHQPFFHRQKKGRPLWVAKWAESQDGVLADSSGNSKWISNPQSRAYTHWLRQKYDTLLVGAGTWLKDQPRLTVRDCAEPHRRHPLILIHDPNHQVPKLENRTGVYVFHERTVSEMMDAVERTDFGFELQSVFCEGGARTLDEMFKTGRVDVVHRFIGDKFLGASKYRIHSFAPEEPDSIWTLAAKTHLGNDLLQEWTK